jgi:ABC-type glycerol-3-phosphate transport system substrate-binding protein
MAAVAAIAALTISLAGCGSSGSGGTGSATEGEITWWGWTPDSNVAARYIAEFNKEYPDITVTYKNFENTEYAAALRSGLQADSGLDVYDVALGDQENGFGRFGEFGLDLKPALEEKFGDDWEDQFNFSHDALTLEGGQVTAVAIGAVASGMIWINKTMFDEFGVTPPTTYDEWVKACDVMRERDKECMTMGAVGVTGFDTETYRGIVSSLDQSAFIEAIRGERPWDDPVFVRGLEIFKQMQDDGIIRRDVTGITQYPDANNAFLSEKAAMVQMGTWYAQYSRVDSAIAAMQASGVTDPEPFEQLPIPFPAMDGGDVPSVYGEIDYGIAVNARSENPDAATTFALWLTTEKNGAQTVANAIDLIPVLKGVEPAWDDLGLVAPDTQIPAIQDLYAQAAASDEPRNAESNPEQLEAIHNAISSVLEGSVAPADAIATLAKALDN